MSKHDLMLHRFLLIRSPGLKVMAALRRLALGIPVDGLAYMVGINRASLAKFISKWEAWFVTR